MTAAAELELLPRPRETQRLEGASLQRPLQVVERMDASQPAQGFELRAEGSRAEIAHADPAGLRYARALVAQLQTQAEPVPALRIRDWPDFPVRGYMLDVSRDRVPTRATLERLVGLLELLRINHLQLYTEHTFAYRDHAAVWSEASPLTAADVRWLDALCAERGIELCANQNCFGHMARWLAHEPYRSLAEAPDGWETRMGLRLSPAVLAPSAESLEFVLGLLRELLPNFSSRRVNVNCDETFELGKGRSRAEVEARGRGAVYLGFLRRLLDALHAQDREVLFWGDILRTHPELIPSVPRQGTQALVWHYEAPTDPATVPKFLLDIFADFGVTPDALRGFEAHVTPFAEAGFPFWVCPGTSTWNALIGRLTNARANLLDAATVGLARGAGGYLITDWGDNGHLQPPSASFPPLAYGAALAWCVEANRELETAPLLDRFVFEAARGTLGAALEEAADLYRGTGLTAVNASPLHSKLLMRDALPVWGDLDPRGLEGVIASLDDCAARIEAASPRCVDGDLVRRELVCALRLARHGAWRIAREAGLPSAPTTQTLERDLAETIHEQRACWLLRSRPGGLVDSLARLEKTLATYG